MTIPRRRRAAALLLALLLSSGATGLYATLTDSAGTERQDIESADGALDFDGGSLVHTVDSSASHVIPGDYLTRDVTLVNRSSYDLASIKLDVEETQAPSLSAWLSLTVEREVTPGVWTPIYGPGPATGAITQNIEGPALAAGRSDHLRLTQRVSNDLPPTFKGSSAHLAYVFTGTQRGPALAAIANPYQFKVNFATQSSTPPSGYVLDYGQGFTTTAGQGWQTLGGSFLNLSANTRVRNAEADPRLDSLIHMQLLPTAQGTKVEGRWEKILENGTYDVTVAVGDPTSIDSRHVIRLEGTKVLDFTPASNSHHRIVTYRVSVTDGRLTVDAIGGANTKLNYLDIVRAQGPPPLNVASAHVASQLPAGNWNLIRGDEFSDTVIDTTRWSKYNGAGNEGVGTRSPSALSQSEGNFVISAVGTVSGGACFCLNGSSFKYGYVEVRARVDKGTGYGPAILLWPSSGIWPADGEIDIVEMPEGNRSKNRFTVHYGANNSQIGWADPFDGSQWHTYGLLWSPTEVTSYLDGVRMHSVTNPAAIPTKNMHVALQLDVGATGHWIPAPDGTAPQPTKMQVDFVRVWQQG